MTKKFSSDGKSMRVEPSSGLLFNNLIWLTSDEAAFYLRKTRNAIYTMVCRQQLHPRKFRRRLFFRKDEIDRLLETSTRHGGVLWQ